MGVEHQGYLYVNPYSLETRNSIIVHVGCPNMTFELSNEQQVSTSVGLEHINNNYQ